MINDDFFLARSRIRCLKMERKDYPNSNHGKLHCNRLIETRASIKCGEAFVTRAYPIVGILYGIGWHNAVRGNV